MAISSKSIIHYTGSLKNLKGIIDSKGLRIKYCNELLEFVGKSGLSVAFPMVCFCDLPLTLAKEHIVKYGSYGIGFSKAWAKANNLNPVLYLEKESTISHYLSTHSRKIAKLEDGTNDEARKAFYELSQILGFCKSHVGPLVRKGKMISNEYVFYDEREWRYVPDQSILGEELDSMIASDEYNKDKNRFNSLLQGKQLNFSHTDISYIIVKSEKDIPVIADCLDARYRSEIPVTELQKLYTKIISVNQIHNDF